MKKDKIPTLAEFVDYISNHTKVNCCDVTEVAVLTRQAFKERLEEYDIPMEITYRDDKGEKWYLQITFDTYLSLSDE